MINTLALQLLDEWRDEYLDRALRLLGVGVSRLAVDHQLDLFTAPERTRNRELDATLDRIREKFGQDALQRGDGLSRPEAVPSTLRRK